MNALDPPRHLQRNRPVRATDVEDVVRWSKIGEPENRVRSLRQPAQSLVQRDSALVPRISGGGCVATERTRPVYKPIAPISSGAPAKQKGRSARTLGHGKPSIWLGSVVA